MVTGTQPRTDQKQKKFAKEMLRKLLNSTHIMYSQVDQRFKSIMPCELLFKKKITQKLDIIHMIRSH